MSYIAPIKASVAKVARKGSDSNHRSKMDLTGAVNNFQASGSSVPNFAKLFAEIRGLYYKMDAQLLEISKIIF